MNLLKAPIAKAGGLITRAAGQGKLILIKNGPHLMVYGGLIGVGVAIYEYCKATIQLEEARKQHRQTLEAIHTSIEDNKEKADFDQKHYSKLIFEEKRDYGLVLVKRYWAPTTLTLASFGLILTGFHKINARLGVMTVAYKALEDSYERYRQNVREDAGEEKAAIDIPAKEEISFDQFGAMQFQVGEIIKCEAVENSKKLLCSQVKIGSSVKQIVSGIRKYYSPEEMVGKKVMVLVNLKPAKLAGVLSEGMLLCAEDADGNLSLMTPEKDMPSGAEIC